MADVAGWAQVTDGDTLVVAGTRVRLHGIDAPESGQNCDDARGRWPCGRVARDALAQLIDGRQVWCHGADYDRYRRLIARCDAGDGDLGAALVESGVASAYRRYSHDYVAAELRARASERGIWRGDDDGYRDPAEYRAARRHAPEVTVPDGADCAIKGNVSANGRIYHLPGQRDYARTQITAERGERWFCSEIDAVAAGWRVARR